MIFAPELDVNQLFKEFRDPAIKASLKKTALQEATRLDTILKRLVVGQSLSSDEFVAYEDSYFWIAVNAALDVTSDFEDELLPEMEENFGSILVASENGLRAGHLVAHYLCEVEPNES